MSARVVAVRIEHGHELGIGWPSPRVSWQVEAESQGWLQRSYEIEIDGVSAGVVDSDDSVLVPWPGPPLRARGRATLRARVTGHDGATSSWSEPVTVEAGLLESSDWTARFVGATDAAVACPYLRRAFAVRGSVEQARLYVAGLGVYEVELNGGAVGDRVLEPGWTSYDHRLQYATYDVADQLRPGANAIGAVLAEGWYRGRIGFAGGHRNVYGEELALLAQLEITYADGSSDVVVTDAGWRWGVGALQSAGLYDGETYDARRTPLGWSEPGFDDSSWAPVQVLDRDLGAVVARLGPPVRRIEEVDPVAFVEAPSGVAIVDFGQNLVGRLRITTAGSAGTTVTLRHAEVLQDGELCTEPLRMAAATDHYTAAGAGEEVWEPRFTTHGFRYAEVTSTGDMPGAVTAVVCHSDMERTGWFECSDARINRLHDNVVWGMRGNFVDIPTDCPQRDERLGWTGDIAMFAPTACFLYRCAGFLSSWLRDLAADQAADGGVPPVIPSVLPFPPTAAWGDASVIVPWVLYERTADAGVLSVQYPSMRSWVDHVLGLAGESRLWDRGFQFGDWLDPAAPPHRPQHGRTDPHLVATAFLAHSTDLLVRAAEVLGYDADAAAYGKIAAEVRAAFAHEYVTGNGLVASDSQTAYALVLCFDLLRDEAQRRHAGDRLARLVRRAGHRIATGFVGTPFICDALCVTGHADEAYALLMQEECPSWLYPVVHGATTVWERWDGILPDGRVNPDQMNSFNHYAFGAVADWLHRTVAGLAPAAPGYRRLLINPMPGGGLTHARARHLTPYGLAEAGWRRDGDAVVVEATVPPNTTATVVLPGQAPFDVGSGTYSWPSL
jgi:alpha-L-rhamnosidase